MALGGSLPQINLGVQGRPGSECPRQTSRREDHHIVRNAQIQPIASSAAIQAQVAPSLCLLGPYEGAWLKDIWDRYVH
ncbi:uncharacterized protein TNCV_369731 [Trichonephila clavipes]|nr:uncharacterized protein TNCV_369731 [Trichonephila clavipes]